MSCVTPLSPSLLVGCTNVAHVIVFVAGTNERSNADTLAQALTEGLEERGISTEKLRLRDLAIKQFTLEYYHPECTLEDDFCMVEEKILAADGIIIATPIWNFSVPAHLKNLIDRIGGFALDAETHTKGQLKGKPFFFIFTGGAPMIAWKAMMHITTAHLPESIKYYGGSVIGRHYEPRCMPGKGRFGLVVDKRPKSLKRLKNHGRRIAGIIQTYEKTGKLPMKYRCTLCVRTIVQAFVNRLTYKVAPY